MPTDRHIAWLAFCEVIRLAVGVCLGEAGRVLERPREYLTEWVGEGLGDGVVNCSRCIRQGVSSLRCGWVRFCGVRGGGGGPVGPAGGAFD